MTWGKIKLLETFVVQHGYLHVMCTCCLAFLSLCRSRIHFGSGGFMCKSHAAKQQTGRNEDVKMKSDGVDHARNFDTLASLSPVFFFDSPWLCVKCEMALQ